MKYKARLIPHKTLEIGGELVKLAPLDLEQTIAVILLISPYIPLVERYLPEIQHALGDKSGSRPDTLYQIFMILRAELDRAPGDLIKLIGLLVGRPPQWVLSHVSGKEVVQIIKELDSVYDFKKVWETAQGWSTVQYVDRN